MVRAGREPIAGVRFVAVPGLGGSGPQHWQRLWARDDPRFEVVEQDHWDRPRVEPWIERLDAAVHSADRPTVLVAHSLGCHAVARWAQVSDSTPIQAALLVAPPDIEFSVAHGAAAIATFAPVTSAPLPFPAWLAASETDPWARREWSSQLAEDWGAEFVNLGDCGHVNTESGHGPWRQGLDLLDQVSAPQ
jgi:predicted alpha/beta hydrolase family esterase